MGTARPKSPMKAFILAAGLGTRLRPLGLGLPKVMVPIGGKPLLEHHVELLKRHGIDRLIVNLHHLPTVIVDHFGDGSRFGVAIDYSPEAELLGTAGAVKRMEPALADGTFLVVYGDNLVRAELAPLLEFHRRQHAMTTIALCRSDEPWTGGVAETDSTGRVLGFVEKPPAREVSSNLVSAGIIVAEPPLLATIPGDVFCDFGSDLLPRLVAEGQRVFAMELDGYVQDIGTPERLDRARRAYAAGWD
jgi:NDP-sugar pyrophosphorylase family protein